MVPHIPFNELGERPEHPVIITGALREQGVGPERLGMLLGERPLRVRRYGATKFQEDKRLWSRYAELVTMRFAEYLRCLEDGTATRDNLYLALVPVEGLESLGLSAIQARWGLEPVSGVNLWCGPSGHVEPLHYDSPHGLLAQLMGHKQLLLFPPEQHDNLYPFPKGHPMMSWFSQVYPERPDYDSFPRFAQALPTRQEVVLQEGEVLFIPSGWWHQVGSYGERMVCAVNQFCLPPEEDGPAGP